MLRKTITFALVLVAASVSASPFEKKLPEPLIGESITDIDADEAGEVEADVTGTFLGKAVGGSKSWGSELEVEIRATKKLGFAVEAGLSGGLDPAPVARLAVVEVRLSAAWALFHDYKRQIHAQLFASARVYEGSIGMATTIESGIFSLPYVIGCQGAFRRGNFNVRATVGAALSEAAPAPVFGNLATLWEWGTKHTIFAGAELNVDGGREIPLAVIPEIALRARLLRLPMVIGAAAPIVLGVTEKAISAGALLRWSVEFDED